MRQNGRSRRGWNSRRNRIGSRAGNDGLGLRKENTMPTRNAEAEWNGDLKGGKGRMKLGSGAYEGQFGFQSRFESGPGTNPEELIAAAHAGCFSMAFSHGLSQAGHIPKSVKTTAKVHLDKVEG